MLSKLTTTLTLPCSFFISPSTADTSDDLPHPTCPTTATSLPRPTDTTDQIMHAAIGLLDEMRRRQPRPVRLIGVSASTLTDKHAPRQMTLFDLTEGETSQREVDKTLDALSEQMADRAVYRATSHPWVQQKRSGR